MSQATEDITGQLQDMGFALVSTLTHDGFDGRQGDTTWEVILGKDGTTYTTKYTMGCAHRHYRGGKPIKFNWNGRMTLHEHEQNKRSKPNNPTLADVVHCLMSEARDIANTSTFEEWCDEFGYDHDSRKAEKTYQACCATYMATRSMFRLDELSELFQDY